MWTRYNNRNAHALSTHLSDGTLLSYISEIQSHLASGTNLFLLLMGLKKLFSALENEHNARHTEAIRAGMGEGNGNGNKRRKSGIGEGQPGREELEVGLMRVQVVTKCYVIQVEKVEEAVEWIEHLSMDISLKPYQRHKQSLTSVLGTSDEKITSGADLTDTYRKMLTCIKGIPDGVAKSIVREYPTVRSLYDAWARCGSEKEQQKMLEGIRKSNNVNGTLTNRNLGTQTSFKVWQAFNTKDPDVFV